MPPKTKKKKKSPMGGPTYCNLADRSRIHDAEDDDNYTPPPKSITATYIPFININDSTSLALVKRFFFCRIAKFCGMDQYTFNLLVNYFTMCYWYQLPNKDYSDVTTVRLGNNMHADNSVVRRRDIEPSHPTKLQLGPNTPEFRALHEKLYNGVIYYLVNVLGMDPKYEKYVRISLRRYLSGRGIGYHSDGDKKIGEKTFSMRMVAGIGPSRTLNFRLVQYDLANPGSSSDRRVIKGMGGTLHTMETGNVSGAYLMPPDMSGKQFFCYTNKDGSIAARAEHEVVPLDEKCVDNGGIMVVDFQLDSIEEVNNALENSKKVLLSLRIPE